MTLDQKAVEAAHAAYAKTTGGTMDGHPIENAITAYLAVLAGPGDDTNNICRCQSCQRSYETDMLIPDDIWEVIKPEGSPVGGGLLCPSCIMDRARTMCGWSVGFVYPDRQGDAVTAGKAALPKTDSGLEVVAWIVQHLGADLITNLPRVAEEYRSDGKPVDSLVRQSEAASRISTLERERDEWKDTATNVVLDGFLLTSRAEAAEARVKVLEEALRPFAQAAAKIERDYGSDCPDDQLQFPAIAMRDFRGARTALGGQDAG